MTFDEFKALAQNPPYPDGKSGYRINVHRFKHQHSFPRATDVLPLSSPLPTHVREEYDAYFHIAMKYHKQEINATEITEQTVSNRHSELNDLLNRL